MATPAAAEASPTITSNNNNKQPQRPLRIGVFGGSFNPIHLGHALLAITTQQTKPVDQVVLVPVFKHAVKRDLLPFEDRVKMCQLAVAPFASSGSNHSHGFLQGQPSIVVSTVEQRVGASNGAMLQGLQQDYPAGTQFFWICGDDFFRWMERPKGLETLQEVHGLIVQRRLHKHATDSTGDRFFKEPLDEQKVRAVAARLNLTMDFIYGELPHFSSTLVRRAPGHWRSFLPQTVAEYLEARPQLLQKLIANLEADSMREETEDKKKQQQQLTATSTSKPSANDNAVDQPDTEVGSKRKREAGDTNSTATITAASALVREASTWIVRGMDVIHAMQVERGSSGLWLSLGTTKAKENVEKVQARTDTLLQDIFQQDMAPLETAAGGDGNNNIRLDEVLGLALELRQVSAWLQRDRAVLSRQCELVTKIEGVEGWMRRLALVEKFNPRIDVLILSLLRALTEIRQCTGSKNSISESNGDARDIMPELLWKWSEAKEALGRERAFVCAGGPEAPAIVGRSLEMRQRLNECIQEKDRTITRVLSLNEQAVAIPSTPNALHRMLESLTLLEWTLMRSFAPSTPISMVHKLLSKQATASSDDKIFDVEQFFGASTTAIDFLLTLTKGLAAASCAG